MKTITTLTLLILTTLAFGQKNKDYLVSYTDSGSGQELIGFKSIKGEVIISPKYSYTYTDTLYSMAIVHKDGEWLGIDRNEKVLLEPFIYDNGPDYVKEGLFRFVENRKMGFANMKGEKIIPAKFDFVTPFADGISEYTLGGNIDYKKGGEYGEWKGAYENGYLNRFGQKFKKVKELKYDKREAWTNSNKHVLLDKNGKIIKTFKK
ncbi:MAG: WG repeat-containing protein [Daejeonella sp.]